STGRVLAGCRRRWLERRVASANDASLPGRGGRGIKRLPKDAATGTMDARASHKGGGTSHKDGGAMGGAGAGKGRGARPPAKTGKPRAPAPGPHATQLGHHEIRIVMAGLMLAMFLGALDQTIVATALPTIGRHFGDFGDISWVVTAYLITATAVTPLY